jgi:hypothetical protein
MSTFSGRPLAEKLGMKASQKVAILRAPEGFEKKLGRIPAGLKILDKIGENMDFVHAFYTDAATLKKELPLFKKCMSSKGMIWVSWKKTGKTDLDREKVMEIAGAAGFKAVSSSEIDQEWSAIKLALPALL